MSERDSLLVAQEILSRLAEGENPPSAEELERTRASLLAAQQKLEEMVKTRESERDSLAIAQARLAELMKGENLSPAGAEQERDSLLVAQEMLGKLTQAEEPPSEPPEPAQERDSLLVAQEMLGQLGQSQAPPEEPAHERDSLLVAKTRLSELAAQGAAPRHEPPPAAQDSLLIARSLLTRMAGDQSAQPAEPQQPAQPAPAPQQQHAPQLSHTPFRPTSGPQNQVAFPQQQGPFPQQQHSPFPQQQGQPHYPQPGYAPYPYAGYPQPQGYPSQPHVQQAHPQQGHPQAPVMHPFGPVGTGFPSHPMLPAVPRPGDPSGQFPQAPAGMFPHPGYQPHFAQPYGFPQYAQQPFPQPNMPGHPAHQGVVPVPSGIPVGKVPGHSSGPAQAPSPVFDAQQRLAQLARQAADKAHANAFESLNIAQRRLAQLAEGAYQVSAEELEKERDSLLVAHDMLHQMAVDKAAAGQLDEVQHAASTASRRLGQLATGDRPILTPEMIAGERDSLLIAQQMLEQLSEQVREEQVPDQDFWIIPPNVGTTGRYGGRSIPHAPAVSMVLAEDDLAEMERRFQQKLVVMAGVTITGVVLLGLIMLFVLF